MQLMHFVLPLKPKGYPIGGCKLPGSNAHRDMVRPQDFDLQLSSRIKGKMWYDCKDYGHSE